jgi:hypothetical protein
MLGSCPNKNSEEWKKLLAQENGNEERALEEWNKLVKEQDDEFEELLQDNPNIPAEEAPKDFAEALQKVKVFLEEKKYELSRKKLKNQREQEAQLARLTKMVNELNGVESINLFIEDSFEKALGAKKYFKSLVADFKDGKINNKDFLEGLVNINDFANNYSILDEISKSDAIEYFGKPVERKSLSEYTPQDKLTTALEIRNFIRTAYINEITPLLAEVLVAQRNTRNVGTINEQIKTYQERIQKIRASELSDAAKASDINAAQKELTKWQNMLIDKERMENILKMSLKDEGVFDYLLNPLISSEDSALALFAKMVKSQFEGSRMEDIAERDEAVEKLKEFRDKSGRSINNIAEFNAGLYEEISVLRRDIKGKPVKENGELVFDKKMSFVQKYDLNLYKDAEQAFYKTNPKPKITPDSPAEEVLEYEARLKEWKIKRNQWYKQNRQPKSTEEIQKITNNKRDELNKGIITNEEYEEWLSKVEYVDKKTGVKTFYGELTEPSDKYINKKWLKLYNEEGQPISPEGEYHKYLTDIYLKDQELLPESQRMGYILPSIPMEDYERLYRKGAGNLVKTNLKESVSIQSYDQALYGANLSSEGNEIDTRPYGRASLSGEKMTMLPVYYTQPMDADDVSVDLIKSVLQFGSMARRYNAMNEIHAEITAFRSIIGERETAVTTASGESILNIAAKKLGFDEYIKSNGTSYSKMHLEAFLEMVVQGESQKAEKIWGLELSKIVNTAMGISAVTTLSMDILKGTANNIQGNIQVAIEAAGGEYFNGKNLVKGGAKYWATIGDNMADFGRLKAESWLGRLTEYYDPIQGNFKDEYGKNVSASVANKFFRTNTLFFNQNFAEHEIQVKTMLALMDATKVIDKETGEEITLLEAHEKYGPILYEMTTDENRKKVKEYKVQIDAASADGTIERKDFDEKQRQDFMNTLHALNKKMHGVYNDFDKGVLQRYAGGRLVLMYRKHLYQGIKRRFKSASFDEELGGATEGMYRVFLRTLVKDTYRYKTQIFKQWSTYSPFEKAQIRKVVAELTIIAALGALILALEFMGTGDDGEEKEDLPYAYYFMMYQAIRMRSETFSYLSPADFWRIAKSPSAITGTIDRFVKFFDQFLLTWDEDKLTYQKQTGVWDKGSNKSWAYFLKLMGFSGYTFSPDEAVKSFKSTFAK